FFSSRRRHTRSTRDWSSDVCSSDLPAASPDRAIWTYARDHGLVIVTKDENFHRLSVLLGPPPKVIWVRLGNCSTDDVIRLLQVRREAIPFVTPPFLESRLARSTCVRRAAHADA